MNDRRGREIPERDRLMMTLVWEWNKRNPTQRLTPLMPGCRPLRQRRLWLDAVDRRN